MSNAAPCSASYSERCSRPSRERRVRSAVTSPVVTTPSSVRVTQPITPSAHMRRAATAWNDSFCIAPSRCLRARVSCSFASTVEASAATTRLPGDSRYRRPSPAAASAFTSRRVSARTRPRQPSSIASTSDPEPRSDSRLDRSANASPRTIVRTASTFSTEPSGARETRQRSACVRRLTRLSASSSSGPVASVISRRSTPDRNSRITSR